MSFAGALGFAYPHMLAALAVVPVVWWLHRRRRRPVTTDLPSLLFLEAELEVAPARRRGVDLELLTALVAATLLAIAAAGPRRLHIEGGHRVRLVVSGGAPADHAGYRERTQRTIEALRATLDEVDVLDVHEEPTADADGAPRPTAEALIDLAQAGHASWRVVMSDRAAPTSARGLGVTWLAVGDAATENAGIVSATLAPAGAGFDVFANVQSSGMRARRVVLELASGEGEPDRVTLDLPAGLAHASHVFSVPRLGLACEVALRDAAGGALEDDLAADDRVVWERRPVRVAWGDALPGTHRQAVEQALLAILGRGAFLTVERDPDLRVLTAADLDRAASPARVWCLCLHPAREGRPVIPAPPGPDLVRSDPLVADLSTGGVDLRYAPGAEVVPAGATPLLVRRSGEASWPVVARVGRTVHFLPDPLQGRPSPARSALWPVFLAGLLDAAVGETAPEAWGFRRRGLLDAESSHLGTTRTSLDVHVPDLSALPPDIPPRWRSFSPWLAGAALLCLALLWIVRWPRSGRTRDARAAASFRVPSAT